MNNEDPSNYAVSLFLSGYNCAESVLLALAKRQNVKSRIIPRISTPFGGGIARTGSVCGCVTGALMAVGLRLGRTKNTEERDRAYSATTSFLNTFEHRFGSLMCHDLTGCDLRTIKGHKRWEKIKESKCANYVKGAIEIVIEQEKNHQTASM